MSEKSGGYRIRAKRHEGLRLRERHNRARVTNWNDTEPLLGKLLTSLDNCGPTRAGCMGRKVAGAPASLLVPSVMSPP